MNPYQPGEDNQDPYEVGYKAGAASRDAEVVSLTNQRDYEYVRAENAEQERDQFEQERDQLREHVTMLRDALLTCSVGDFSTGHVIPPSFDEKLVEEALAATPEQSLSEYRNKVIEECAAKCKDKHVNGNWMYDYREECEAAILDMKEQP